MADKFAPLCEQPLEQIRAQLETNAIGFYLCMREAINMMRDQEPLAVPGITSVLRPAVRGSIVVLSTAAIGHTVPTVTGYSMGKWAGEAMLRTAGLSLPLFSCCP